MNHEAYDDGHIGCKLQAVFNRAFRMTACKVQVEDLCIQTRHLQQIASISYHVNTSYLYSGSLTEIKIKEILSSLSTN